MQADFIMPRGTAADRDRDWLRRHFSLGHEIDLLALSQPVYYIRYIILCFRLYPMHLIFGILSCGVECILCILYSVSYRVQ